MNITLTIQAPELVGALNNLANAFGNNPLAGVAMNTDSKVFTAEKKVEDKKPAKQSKPKPKAEEQVPEEESAPFAPVEEPPVEEEPEDPQDEPESSISLDVVTTKTREFIQSNPAHRAKLKAFLDKKGAKKVTDLPPSTYYEFLDFIGAAD